MRACALLRDMSQWDPKSTPPREVLFQNLVSLAKFAPVCDTNVNTLSSPMSMYQRGSAQQISAQSRQSFIIMLRGRRDCRAQFFTRKLDVKPAGTKIIGSGQYRLALGGGCRIQFLWVLAYIHLNDKNYKWRCILEPQFLHYDPRVSRIGLARDHVSLPTLILTGDSDADPLLAVHQCNLVPIFGCCFDTASASRSPCTSMIAPAHP